MKRLEETWKKAHRRPQGGPKPRRAWKNKRPSISPSLQPWRQLPFQASAVLLSSARALFSAVSPTAPSKCNRSAASGAIPGIPGLGTLHRPLCPRQSFRAFCSQLCKPSTLPQLCQDGLQPSEPEQKGGSHGLWEAMLSLLREKPDCQGISQGPLRPADLSSPPRQARGGREPRIASNKPKK